MESFKTFLESAEHINQLKSLKKQGKDVNVSYKDAKSGKTLTGKFKGTHQARYVKVDMGDRLEMVPHHQIVR